MEDDVLVVVEGSRKGLYVDKRGEHGRGER